MDEPLANLDAKLRLEMRVELKRLQLEMGQTLVYVTHDQIEALSMADRIAVMNEGVLQQVDVPDTIYRYPSNTFVATVVGSPPMNFLDCAVVRENGSVSLRNPAFRYSVAADRHPFVTALAAQPEPVQKVILGIRPEDMEVSSVQPSVPSLPARVSVVEPLGSETILDLELGDEIIKASIPPTQRLHPNDQVWVRFDPSKLHVFDTATRTRFYSTDAQQAFHLSI